MKTQEIVGGARWAGPLLIAVLLSIPVRAQEPVVRWVFVKSGPIAATVDPASASAVVGTVPSGTWLEVVEVRDDWYRVLLPSNGETSRPARSGWIRAATVDRVSRPARPGVAPAPPPAAGAAAAPVPGRVPATAAGPAPQPADTIPSSLPPPASRAPAGGRFFLAVNGARQESSLTFQDSRSEPFYQETSSWTARYGAKGGYGFDIGGGALLWRGLAAAVAVSRFEDAKRPATIGGEIPHPFHFERPRAISGESQRLRHAEQAVHLSAQWMLPPLAGLRLSVFGGPSFFSLSRDLIEDVDFSEAYPYNTATYEGAVIRSVSRTQRGFHAGMDVSWFVTRRIGLGAVARYAQGEALLESPAHGRGVPIDVGGIQVGAGLRLNLGGWR